MTPERWREVWAVFHATLERPPAQRRAVLESECGADVALRCEVESLLAAHDEAGGFGDRPVSMPLLLEPGTPLGPYVIDAPLGTGGMGEVYRARDPRLGRDVAIKVLPPHLTLQPERLARFAREARLLATLNHPHVGAIYGIEQSEAGQALVMELVEGEDLSERIARGPVPLPEALRIGRQIAEALEAAHTQGIIHRDLKPANIKVREDGTAKVLDFGLAKAIEPAGSAMARHPAQPGGHPTPPLTHVDLILGTAAYMSPEQAQGRTVDTRADIWAFGVVVFEMLTGERVFTGASTAATLAAVLTTEPDWTALPAGMSPGLGRLLRWCLQKDPKRRLQAIGDARVQIEDLLTGVTDDMVALRPTPRRPATVAALIAFAVGGVASAWLTWTLTHSVAPAPRPMRFAIQAESISGFSRDVALSPDGTLLVYATDAADGNRLMVRALDQLEAVPLGRVVGASPFFSPDGRWIGFFSGTLGGDLQKVAVTGGRPVSLGRTHGHSGGATWGPDETILFAVRPSTPGAGLFRVPARGGEPTVLTIPDAAHGEVNHLFPSLLPGGRAVLFTITAVGSIETAQVAVLDLITGRQKTLIHGGSQAEFVNFPPDSRAGYLVYAAAGTLRAVRFDPRTLEVLSDPVRVVESVSTLSNGSAEFSVSRHGALVYIPGGMKGTARSMVWVDRQGHEEPIAAPLRAYDMPRLSPDGTRIAVSIGDQDQDIWIWSLARHTLTRLTDAPGEDWYPVWTPDSRRIIYASAGLVDGANNNLFWQDADNTGAAGRLTKSPNRQGPASITQDGSRLIVMENMPNTGWDIGVLRLLDHFAGLASVSPLRPPDGGLRSPQPLVHTPATELFGEVSPDGNWLAYQSDASGQNQVWVRSFPNVDGGKWQISSSGGMTPVWSHDGEELFYLDGTNALTSVSIQTTPTFSVGPSTKLFDGRYVASPFWRTYDVSPDGEHFLMIKAVDDQPTTSATIVVVLNWAEELKRLVPTE